MTHKLYWDDAYIREFDAKVLSIDGDQIELDKTAFYPTSGGQMNDIGEINSLKVFDVRYDPAGNVVHFMENLQNVLHDIKVGGTVHCEIDWPRRYNMMRLHTAAHIISAALVKNIGNISFTGSQIYPDRARMDFNLPTFDDATSKLIEDKSNEIVQMNLPIVSRIITKEEVQNSPDLKRVDPKLYEKYKEFRVVEIKDFDVQLDGGTHVKSTSEVGKIKIVDRENKGKNNKRITIVVM